MFDESKIEELVLALLGAFEFDNGRVWKQIDFDVMSALHKKGYIFNPYNKAKSIQLTYEGLTKAKECAQKYLAKESGSLDHENR